MKNLLYKYLNGNYQVFIYDDGTKIRESFNVPVAENPESCDIKITNYCDLGVDGRDECSFCHEKSNLNGEHADLSFVREAWKGLPKGVELAIGGGNPLSHPGFPAFARAMKEDGYIVNLTMNQIHLKQNHYFHQVNRLLQNKYIYGLGISARQNMVDLLNIVHSYNKISQNIVVHFINGIDSFENIEKYCSSVKNPKILILGYKVFGNGNPFYSLYENKIEAKKLELYNKLALLMDKITRSNGVISFDNLAIEQLCVKRFFTHESYNDFYQGDDGKFTFYLDAVNQTFAKSSTSIDRYSCRWPMYKNAKNMFQAIREFNK